MELATVKGDTVVLLYHPAEDNAEVGEQFALLEMPDGQSGLVVQVIANELIEFDGLAQGMIQRILESRYARTQTLLDGETGAVGGGMDEVRDIKIARAKIRKRITAGEWHAWDGYVPTRNIRVQKLGASELLPRVMPAITVPLPDIFSFAGQWCQLEGPRLGHVCAAVGAKGQGKSHLLKLLILALATRGIPVLAFDMNGEYEQLPSAQVLKWQNNFRFRLSELGPGILKTVVRAVNPFAPGSPSESTFENRLVEEFRSRRQACKQRGTEFTIDLPYLRDQFSGPMRGGNAYVKDAILERLDLIDDMGLFQTEVDVDRSDGEGTLRERYEAACAGSPIVFDMGSLSPSLRHALVKAVNQTVERISEAERVRGTRRLPYLIYDEGHLYLDEDAILGLITRVRHVGAGCVFASNTPRRLPADVFRQLDNLVLLKLGHDDDVRAVAETAVVDEETVKSLAKRLPKHHALVVGALTSDYPLVVKVAPLPEGVPSSGVTRSPWDRFTILP